MGPDIRRWNSYNHRDLLPDALRAASVQYCNRLEIGCVAACRCWSHVGGHPVRRYFVLHLFWVVHRRCDRQRSCGRRRVWCALPRPSHSVPAVLAKRSTCAHMCVFLLLSGWKDNFLLTGSGWAAVMIGVAGLVNIAYLLTRLDPVYPLVYIWACAAIHTGHSTFLSSTSNRLLRTNCCSIFSF